MKALSTEDDGVLGHPVVVVILASPHRLEHANRSGRDPVEAKAHVVSVSVGAVLDNNLPLPVTPRQILQILELIDGGGPASEYIKWFNQKCGRLI